MSKNTSRLPQNPEILPKTNLSDPRRWAQGLSVPARPPWSCSPHLCLVGGLEANQPARPSSTPRCLGCSGGWLCPAATNAARAHVPHKVPPASRAPRRGLPLSRGGNAASRVKAKRWGVRLPWRVSLRPGFAVYSLAVNALKQFLLLLSWKTQDLIWNTPRKSTFWRDFSSHFFTCCEISDCNWVPSQRKIRCLDLKQKKKIYIYM